MSQPSEQVRNLRTDYIKGELDESSVPENPFVQFQKWMDEAIQAEVQEPNAMALGTVDSEGQPAVRIVLLRGFDERGFVFFTNYKSRKANEMATGGKAALTFFWPDLERQVRIEGVVEKTSSEESDTYFHGRPRDSRLGAWASPQSKVLENRKALERMVEDQKGRFEGGEVERPGFWGGYRVQPTRIEFWQGRASRLHDRIEFRKREGNWEIARLAP